MTCLFTSLGIIPLVLTVFLFRERHHAKNGFKARAENNRLRIRLDRLESAFAIDVEIDALTDDQLIERMRASPHLRE